MHDTEPVENANDHQRKAFCDLTVERAVELMAESGAELPMIVDRLVTYGVAHVVAELGRAEALRMLQGAIESVERGVFDGLDPTARPANMN